MFIILATDFSLTTFSAKLFPTQKSSCSFEQDGQHQPLPFEGLAATSLHKEAKSIIECVCSVSAKFEVNFSDLFFANRYTQKVS